MENVENNSSRQIDLPTPKAKKAGWFGGRMQRKEWWRKIAIQTGDFILIVCAMVNIELYLKPLGLPAWILFMIKLPLIISGILIPFSVILINVKRLHDLNMSGLWVIVFWFGGLLPFVRWIVIPFQIILLGFVDGMPGPNSFGPDPKGRTGALAHGEAQTKQDTQPNDTSEDESTK